MLILKLSLMLLIGYQEYNWPKVEVEVKYQWPILVQLHVDQPMLVKKSQPDALPPSKANASTVQPAMPASPQPLFNAPTAKSSFELPQECILYVTASWCGPCRSVAPELEKMRQVGWHVNDYGTENSHIVVVDFDRHPDLAQKYQVGLLPTFIKIRDGKPIWYYAGPLNRWQLGLFWKEQWSMLAAAASWK